MFCFVFYSEGLVKHNQQPKKICLEDSTTIIY